MKNTLLLILITVALLGWAMAARDGVANGVLREKIAEEQARVTARNRVIAALAEQKARVDTVAGEAKTKYVAAKVNFRHLADSIEAAVRAKGELPPPLIPACKLTLDAADAALSGCARQVAVRDSLLAQKDTALSQKDSLLTLERKRHPGWFKQTGTKLLWGTVGYGVCKAVSK